MAKFRNSLPQVGGEFFMSDGGIETTLIFLEGLELPYFAAFELLRTEAGEAALRKYFRTYGQLASEFNVGLVLETATWRAHSDCGQKLGYSAASLADANRKSVCLLEEIRDEYESDVSPVVISGCVGPRGDGYVPGALMSAQTAEEYHRPQIESFADSAADLVSAITMNYVEEAIGIVQAAKQSAMPVVISFTVETNGRLPTGHSLHDAITQVDDSTDGYASYFMINCAHPTHFDDVLAGDGAWLRRICGLRANASTMSHAELDEATALDAGDPDELAKQYATLRSRHPQLKVMGGCCGTDHRHISKIAEACLRPQAHEIS